MRYSAAQFSRKLKGRSLTEFRARLRQRISVLWDRSIGSMRGEMTDAELVGELVMIQATSRWQSVSVSDVLPDAVEAVRRRITKAPGIPALADRARLRAVMTGKWPDESEAIIREANRAAESRFRLFGSSDLDFGVPVNWRLEPVSGKQTPLVHWSQIDYLNPDVSGDKKVTWELNRHSHFVSLGQAYCLTRDEDYTMAFINQANSWMDQNPPELGINWTSSLEAAFRAIAWIWALHLFIESRRLSSTFLARILKYLIGYANHIETYLSTYFSPNTHLTGEALGLFYIGACFPEFRRAEAWRKKGLAVLVQQLPLQVGVDGVYFEQSSYYHRYTVDIYLHLLILARGLAVRLPGEIQKTIIAMTDYLTWITRPDARPTLVGDDDGGRVLALGSRDPYDFRDSIGVAACLFGRGDWKYVAGADIPEILWLLGPARVDKYERQQATAPSGLDRAFDSAGHYVARSGWTNDSTYCFFRCGPHGALSGAHSHADQLSFELCGAGSPWLVDPGTYTYTLDRDARNLFRLTAGHNALTVDGLSQSMPHGPFSWFTRARGTADIIMSERAVSYISGEEDGYESLPDPVRHRRSIALLRPSGAEASPSYIAVTDYVAANRVHTYDMWRHFAPGVIAENDRNCFRAVNERGRFLFINQFSTAPFELSTEIGYVSDGYRRRAPAQVGRMTAAGKGRHRFTAILFPMAEKSDFTPDVQAADEAGNVIRIRYGDVTDLFLFEGGNPTRVALQVASQSRMVMARRVGSTWRWVAMVQGKELSLRGTFRIAAEREIKYGYADLQRHSMKITADEGQSIDLSVFADIDTVEINGACCRVPATGHVKYLDGAWIPVIDNEESERIARVRG